MSLCTELSNANDTILLNKFDTSLSSREDVEKYSASISCAMKHACDSRPSRAFFGKRSLLVPTRNLMGSHLSLTANASFIHFDALISVAGFVKSKTATITIGIENRDFQGDHDVYYFQGI